MERSKICNTCKVEVTCPNPIEALNNCIKCVHFIGKITCLLLVLSVIGIYDYVLK